MRSFARLLFLCILKCVLYQTYNSANVVIRGSATRQIDLFVDGVYVNSTTLPYTPVVTTYGDSRCADPHSVREV